MERGLRREEQVCLKLDHDVLTYSEVMASLFPPSRISDTILNVDALEAC